MGGEGAHLVTQDAASTPILGQWQMWLEDAPWKRHRGLYIQYGRQWAGERGQVQMVASTLDWGAAVTPALTETLEASQDNVGDVTGFLQAALDVAWAAGMRPKGIAEAASELSAVRYHLEDMRTLALKKGDL